MAKDLKLMFCPLDVAGSENVGTARGWKYHLGAENVLYYDYLARSRQLSIEQVNIEILDLAKQYNLFYCQLQDTNVITPQTLLELKDMGLFVFQWNGDCRSNITKYMLECAKVCDINFHTGEGICQNYRNKGVFNVACWQIACDNYDLFPDGYIQDFITPEIVMCGNHYNKVFPESDFRLEVARTLQKEFGSRFGVVGSGWPSDVRVVGKNKLRDQWKVYAHPNCKIIIGVNHYSDCETFYSDRQFIAMASGKPYITNYIKGMEKDFVINRENFHGQWRDWQCMVMNSPIACLVADINTLLETQEMRQVIGNNGKNFILAKHTWEARIGEIMPIIQKHIK